MLDELVKPNVCESYQSTAVAGNSELPDGLTPVLLTPAVVPVPGNL